MFTVVSESVLTAVFFVTEPVVVPIAPLMMVLSVPSTVRFFPAPVTVPLTVSRLPRPLLLLQV